MLGLIWQLIKMYLFKQISISAVPGLINLLMDGEDIADLMKLSPEQLLVRWVNHQLQKVRLYYLHFGPSGVRALPLAAGINVGGHYKWHFFLFLSLLSPLSSSLLILPEGVIVGF